MKRLFQAVERLPHYPESGRVVPEFDDPTVREMVGKPCRIVHRVDHERRTVAIVRVWHAAGGVPDIE